jgi:hypothetical protein
MRRVDARAQVDELIIRATTDQDMNALSATVRKALLSVVGPHDVDIMIAQQMIEGMSR